MSPSTAVAHIAQEIEDDEGGVYYKDCPECDGIMYWDGCWFCSNCGYEIETDEDDYDGIIEG